MKNRKRTEKGNHRLLNTRVNKAQKSGESNEIFLIQCYKFNQNILTLFFLTCDFNDRSE